jgi:hypothetical protein
MSLTNIIQEFELNCSLATLQRALEKRGFHKHTLELREWLLPKVKNQRLEFATKCQQKKKQFWQKDGFTDKSTFNTRILRRLKV